MLELAIKAEQIERAKVGANDLGKLNNSITRGDGNLSGILGEIVVADHFGWQIKHTYDFDLISGNGKRVDVKTKRTTVEPKPYYECSIAAFNTRQKCDSYVFVRIGNDMERAWILGWKAKRKYFQEARFLKKGETDGDNGFVVKADCYNMAISQLDDWLSTA